MTTASGPYRASTVVEATVTFQGQTERRRLFRTVYAPLAWVAERDVRGQAHFEDAELSDVTVLYDPPPPTPRQVLDVDCPNCGAGRGEPCHARVGPVDNDRSDRSGGVS